MLRVDSRPQFEGQGVIITDCLDPNARMRQEVRFESLFGVKPSFVGVEGEHADLEAAGHLVDVLDSASLPRAYPKKPTVVLVNVAPRGDEQKKKGWDNGTPFCYFRSNGNTVFSTYEGRALALAQKQHLVSSVHLLDVPEVSASLVEDEMLTDEEADQINNTQFRSRDFLPLAAHQLVVRAVSLPSRAVNLERQPNVEGRVWWIDNFGNAKTTTLPEEIGFEEGQTIKVNTAWHRFYRKRAASRVGFYERLTEVPTGSLGVTIGSSRHGRKRWLEVVIQRGDAAKSLGLKVGSVVFNNLDVQAQAAYAEEPEAVAA